MKSSLCFGHTMSRQFAQNPRDNWLLRSWSGAQWPMKWRGTRLATARLWRACWSVTSANPNRINKHFLRGNRTTGSLSFCACAAEVCNFSSLRTFLTFTCATHQNCTNIKQFSPPNNKFSRKTINFYELLAPSEEKAETFHWIEAKRNQNFRFSLHFSSPFGLLFS